MTAMDLVKENELKKNGLSDLLHRVRYVPKRVEHHAQHSGYDKLFAASGMQPARSSLWVRLSGLIPGGLAWRLWLLRPQPSQKSGLEAELAAIPWVARGRGRLCHFIYGEDTYLFTPLWKRSGNYCVATLHYPPEMLTQRINPGSLKGLDAIIIVGENQRDWLSKIFPGEHIYFCPHHVDTEFFCPEQKDFAKDTKANTDRLVCVGNLFRDYDALLDILRILRTQYLRNVTLDIVTPRDMSGHPISKEAGVTIHKGIDDEALRSLYRNATVGTLPLTDSTANNALLEMMACGLPIVTTDIGGIPDYVKDSGTICQPLGERAGFADAVNILLQDANARRIAGQQNREIAERELSLPACEQKMAAIYRQVIAGKGA